MLSSLVNARARVLMLNVFMIFGEQLSVVISVPSNTFIYKQISRLLIFLKKSCVLHCFVSQLFSHGQVKVSYFDIIKGSCGVKRNTIYRIIQKQVGANKHVLIVLFLT